MRPVSGRPLKMKQALSRPPAAPTKVFSKVSGGRIKVSYTLNAERIETIQTHQRSLANAADSQAVFFCGGRPQAGGTGALKSD